MHIDYRQLSASLHPDNDHGRKDLFSVFLNILVCVQRASSDIPVCFVQHDHMIYRIHLYPAGRLVFAIRHIRYMKRRILYFLALLVVIRITPLAAREP